MADDQDPTAEKSRRGPSLVTVVWIVVFVAFIALFVTVTIIGP